MTRPAHSVHVWCASLDLPESNLAAFAHILSNGEMERSQRFRFRRDQERFIAGRGFLRTVLGHYLGVQPRDLEFAYGPNGKPFLKDPGVALHFNLAHSADVALLGVSRAAQVGIDVEQIRSMSDADELVERFFSARESAQFRAVPQAQKAEAFFNLWTRKEALLKATGEGIGYLLNKVEVSFLPGARPEFLSLPEGQNPKGLWSLHHLSPKPEFVGAVAIPIQDSSVVCRAWDGKRMEGDLEVFSL